MDERECPPPVHTSRDPWPPGMLVPSPAERLRKGVVAAGWQVKVTYAQGYALPVKLADPAYPLATVAVRFRRGGRGGYVVYHQRLDRTPAKWEAKSLMVFGSDHWPVVTGLGVADVVRYLIEDWTSAQVAAWRAELEAKVRGAKERAAKAAAERPKKAKVI